MRKAAFLIVLLLAVNAAAIGKFVEQPPADIPAGANITVGADVEEAPAPQQTRTDVLIVRAVPDSVQSGQTFQVKLTVTNKYTGALNLLTVDPQRQGITYIGGPEPYIANYEGLKIPLFRWQDSFAPGQTREYTYQVQAAGPGTITFPPATVNDDYGNTFETAPASVRVECRPTGACGPGENYVNCPADCQTGGKDDVCDGVADGRIDPDCAPGADPDSATTTTSTLPATKPLANENKPASACNLFLLPLYSAALAILTRRLF